MNEAANLAKILDGLGGPREHRAHYSCAARLRVTPVCLTMQCRTKKIEPAGVLSVIEQSGQTQVVPN